MTNFNFIVTLFLLTALSCGQKPIKSVNETSSAKSEANNSQIVANLDYIKFGVYCGECYGHCSTMYQYNMMGNVNTLLVDTTESYFKNNGNVVCKTQIAGRDKMQLASNVAAQIPKRMLNNFKTTEQFGCPDCTDGCGIYFEFKRENETKKFYIDTDTTKIPNVIKIFSQLIVTTSNQLGQNLYNNK